MNDAIYVFALLGGACVTLLFGWITLLACADAYDIAWQWRRGRQWHMTARRERAIAIQPLSSMVLGARCWLLDDATDPASGGRACTVVLRDDVSGAVIEVAATDPRITKRPCQ